MVLWSASKNSGMAIWYRFPGDEITNLLFIFFEDSNEELMGREQKEEIP